MNLEQKIKQLPDQSGIYQYFDKNNRLLYVGKAKSLKKRVKSYFSFTPSLMPSLRVDKRVFKMLSESVNMEYIVVESEHDALILENSLIKQLKPKYNILLRDDKTYPYIYIDYSQDFPRLEITRKVIKGDVEYFGPFSIGARDLLETIYEVIPLVQKKSCIKGNKACLFFQINRCLAPCENRVTKEEYALLIKEAKELLNNKSKMIKLLEAKMTTLSSALRFEEAGKIRDKITSIKKSNIATVIDLANDEDLDVFAILNSTSRAVIVRVFTREGKIVSSDYTYIKANEHFNISEAYKRAIINYYDKDIPLSPKAILLANDIEDIEDLKKFVAYKFGKKIDINTPKIGDKKRLIDMALKNAQELLKHDNNNISILKDIQKLCLLDSLPLRIEVFDNSMMMSQATVGAMVVWEERWIKSDYRHYNLNSKDEYAQMREMLTHRAKSFEKSSPPDLWVIDGGKALLSLAKSIINSSGSNVDVIAISKEKIDSKAYRAKGGAKDNIYFNEDILKLSTNDKRLQFLQLLRDESHRFVIDYHRKTKRKEDKEISLLKIKGIGEGKIRKLLNFFGSFENIKKASIKELRSVLNEKDSNSIKSFYKL